MHQLAAERLGERATRVRFVERSFREPAWVDGLGPFDVVVTHQAVHELRHKDHAGGLHAQVRPLLAAGGRYLVCDHYLGGDGLSNDQLYMTVDQQREALRRAGFAGVEAVLVKGGLALHRAR
jgi:predicted methyltransferase